ncbi:Gamma-aminobutyric acid type B receptor subunit 2 [Holothuria leucospilota]|uniref:Gamma-aminobutyric acid type B receptor subunit 2 n=1 Tax=Holothuria leucospilota TaxID=206669 RepID=A0A9Q1CFH8_HOLLE|nr:Gamma-aminobutyric acid type B receptor subunit 2 [Holothuria leucospilota]
METTVSNRLKNVSSRNWNQILLIGFVLLLASIPLTKSELSPSLSDEINLLLCQSKLYVRSIGYVLVVSTMVARTWKTYNLYVIKAKKVIMDWRIYLFIATSLFVDGVCLFAKHQFFPHHITEITLETKQIPLNESLIYHRHFVKICAPEDSLKSTLVLLWDKLCLLMAGSYLAYEIRTVKVGMLDDSKAFAWSIYNLLICSICACLLSYLLRDDSKNLFIFTSSLVLVYCCVTMVMVSVPKLWILLSKQRLQNIMVSTETPVDEDNHVNIDSSLEGANLPKTETFRRYNDRYGKIPAALMNEHVQLTRQLDHVSTHRRIIHWNIL